MISNNAAKTGVTDVVFSLDAPAKENTLLVGSDIPAQELLELSLSQKVRHICQPQNPFYELEIQTSSLMIHHPQLFFDYPIASIIDPLNTNESREKELLSFCFRFSKSSEKQLMLDALLNYLKTITKSNSLQSEMLLVADELFTNAVYNAPVAHLKGKAKAISRSDKSIQMGPGKYGQIFAGFADNRLVLACFDPYGSLILTKLMERIKECYAKGVSEMMTMGQGGVGIGAYMIYSAATSYFAAVKKGEATLIACSFPLKMDNRTRLSLPKNIHLYGL